MVQYSKSIKQTKFKLGLLQGKGSFKIGSSFKITDKKLLGSNQKFFRIGSMKRTSHEMDEDTRRGVDYIGVSCVFYCHDGKGNLLFHKRSKKCRDEIGCWDVGAGSMEFGESFEEAVRREIKEEYCCSVLDLKFLGVNNVLRNHEGRKTHWVSLLFAAKVDPKKVKIGDREKMEEIAWFSLENLPRPLHSMFMTHLEWVQEAGIL